MNTILLKAKHWQIFLLVVALPAIYQITNMIISINEVVSSGGLKNQSPDPKVFVSLYNVPSVGSMLYMVALMAWFWAIVTGLKNHVPQEVKLKYTRFKIFFVFPFVYILIFTFVMKLLIDQMFEMQKLQGTDQMNQFFVVLKLMVLIIPLHIFAMFCILHTVYYVVKTYKTSLLQRNVDFSDLIGDFFLLLIFPIGVWILQPNINKIEKGIYENSEPVTE